MHVEKKSGTVGSMVGEEKGEGMQSTHTHIQAQTETYTHLKQHTRVRTHTHIDRLCRVLKSDHQHIPTLIRHTKTLEGL